jgi:GT2 family glycosyltransferase
MKMFRKSDGRYTLTKDSPTQEVDWVAGCLMLFHTREFKSIGGFDEKFFLYYEDVDICAKTWAKQEKVLVCRDSKLFMMRNDKVEKFKVYEVASSEYE